MRQEYRHSEAETRPVSLPRYIPSIDIDEAKERAARFIEHRTIKSGLDAWTAIDHANSFENWKKIGAALLIGKRRALFRTGANRPMGRRYCAEFNQWIVEHGFDRMPQSRRFWAIALAENAEAITAWRNTLPERQGRRLVDPQSVVRRWAAATGPNGKSATDFKRDAVAAWQRFVTAIQALPPDVAAPLKATATEFLGR